MGRVQGTPMDRWFRRSILAGVAGALSACASGKEPPVNADWLLGQWDGGIEGQRLVVTSVQAQNSLAQGTWAGEPVSIAVHGGQISFNTASGLSVQLAQGSGMLIGTVDRAPWLVPGPPLALVFLRPATPLA